MASSMRSSFVGAMSVSSVSKAVEPRVRSRTLRVVSQSSSTAMVGSEGNMMKPDGEVSRFLGTGIEKQDQLWWAPLYNVSADEQWENILTPQGSKNENEQAMSASPGLTATASTSIALPDVVGPQSNGSRPNSGRVAFTAEKARALRKSMRASETWHDGWYHSAIASRLAEQID